MKVIADLHLHSKYSRAVSAQMIVPVMAQWAAKKGIGLVATGDWTHPLWIRELQASLEEAGDGVYKLNSKLQIPNYKSAGNEPLFLLSTELSSIYSQTGKTRRIHTVVFAPSFETVNKIAKELTSRGVNLISDGRPIMGLSVKDLTKLILEIDERCLVIPAHVWTPHFSLYGSISGFDSIDECFGDMSRYVYAVETGLSSSPAMNWRIEELGDRAIVSFSDAHSPVKLGREATIFEIGGGGLEAREQGLELGYKLIREAITGLSSNSQPLVAKIAGTIEFYPEEGKYHYTGHRKCEVVQSPEDTKKKGTTCHVCGKPLTVGVMHRVEELAGKKTQIETKMDKFGVKWVKDKEGKRAPYVMLVPLLEILSEALRSGVGSQKVLTAYEQLVDSFGNEFNVLLKTNIEDVARIAGERVGEGIRKVRSGNIAIDPGYDGVFGKVRIWSSAEDSETKADQATLF